MNMPKRVDITPEQMEGLLERAQASMSEKDFEVIKGLAETIMYLGYVVDSKNTSINRLLKLLFGSQTEKTSKVTKKNTSGKPKTDKKKNNGHGKNGKEAYTGAEKITISHETLKHKDNCPSCGIGKVYDTNMPGVLVRVTGNPPCTGKIYELQKLRCNLCGMVYTARAPDNIGEKKYDEAAGAIIALLKYGTGMPFNRLSQLQAFLGVPLPSSTQWEIVEAVADKIHPVYRALIRHAAQGDIVYNDDTTMKIMELVNRKDDEVSTRKGMYTTGIVSTTNNLKVAVFITGNHHAGENLEDVLAYRSKDLSAPVQMCDALSRNIPKTLKTIIANCLAHARRKFIDIEGNYPDECVYILSLFEKIYTFDDHTKEMTPDDRLRYHQENSGPVMEEMHTWLKQQVKEKKAEPNSDFGSVVSYMLKHWPELTLFLRNGKAPLDNNICERALKKSILHRKNSLFYKTQHGAYIGDLFMSLIHTCGLCNVNPFEYLKMLQLHTSDLFKNPENWMPWNYHQTAAAIRS